MTRLGNDLISKKFWKLKIFGNWNCLPNSSILTKVRRKKKKNKKTGHMLWRKDQTLLYCLTHWFCITGIQIQHCINTFFRVILVQVLFLKKKQVSYIWQTINQSCSGSPFPFIPVYSPLNSHHRLWSEPKPNANITHFLTDRYRKWLIYCSLSNYSIIQWGRKCSIIIYRKRFDL